LSLLMLSLRTSGVAVKASAVAFMLLCALFVVSVPVGIGVTLGERGAAAVGGGGVGFTWGPPEDMGYFVRRGIHFNQRLSGRGPIVYLKLRIDFDYKTLNVPLPIPMAAALVPVFWHTNRVRRRQRRKQCIWCGYDLKNLQRCPECGRANVTATRAEAGHG
jgi:hypothetical protein